MITLFNKNENCCGCGACENICPKTAITMKENEYGFIHPEINRELCIECGLCKMACNFQNKSNYSQEHNAYAAVTKDEEILMKSTSGGIFTTLAKSFLEDGGYVAGAIYDDNFNVVHVVSNQYEDLLKIQGSKYVQSSIGKTYKQVKELLLDNHKVLFSGTPCQVDGLYGYLMKNYDNLYTIDIVCHGVPSNKMFQDYLKSELQENEKIKNFSFRDKSQLWGKFGKIEFSQEDKKRHKNINSGNSSYYYLFNEHLSFRDSCYKCKYASHKRPSDITIGDYWGISNVEPDMVKNNQLNEQKGVSLMITNSTKGDMFLSKYNNQISFFESNLENVSKYNHNLKEPSLMHESREGIFNIYLNKSYEHIINLINKKMKIESFKIMLKRLMPRDLKKYLKSKIKG